MRSGAWLTVGGLAVVGALGALFWIVPSSTPSVTSSPATSPHGAEPPVAPPSTTPRSPASTPIPTAKADRDPASTGTVATPKPVETGTPVETDPRTAAPRPDPFAAIVAEPRDEAFAGPREIALVGVLDGRLDARKVENVDVERAECFTSTCVVELGLDGMEQLAAALDAIQSGPLGDSVTFEGSVPDAARSRVRIRIGYGPDNLDHEAFLSMIGGAVQP